MSEKSKSEPRPRAHAWCVLPKRVLSSLHLYDESGKALHQEIRWAETNGGKGFKNSSGSF